MRTAAGHEVEDNRWVHECRTPAEWDRWWDEMIETAEPFNPWPWVLGGIVVVGVLAAFIVWGTEGWLP